MEKLVLGYCVRDEKDESARSNVAANIALNGIITAVGRTHNILPLLHQEVTDKEKLKSLQKEGKYIEEVVCLVPLPKEVLSIAGQAISEAWDSVRDEYKLNDLSHLIGNEEFYPAEQS